MRDSATVRAARPLEGRRKRADGALSKSVSRGFVLGATAHASGTFRPTWPSRYPRELRPEDGGTAGLRRPRRSRGNAEPDRPIARARRECRGQVIRHRDPGRRAGAVLPQLPPFVLESSARAAALGLRPAPAIDVRRRLAGVVPCDDTDQRVRRTLCDGATRRAARPSKGRRTRANGAQSKSVSRHEIRGDPSSIARPPSRVHMPPMADVDEAILGTFDVMSVADRANGRGVGRRVHDAPRRASPVP